MMIRACSLWLFMALAATAVSAGQLKHISIEQQGNKNSLLLTIDGSFTHKIFTLVNPHRVVIDLNNAELKADLSHLKSPLIQHVRSGYPAPHTLRLVLDVTQILHVSSSPWQSQGIRIDLSSSGASLVKARPQIRLEGKPNPIVPAKIAILAKPNPLKPAIEVPKMAQSAPAITHYTPIQVLNSPSRRLRDVIVVLDAGHGGKDPGAKGPRHSKEKDVVLAITLKLKQLIDRQPGMKAVLTRSGDYYVGLRPRLDKARKYNGDIFVSIHADAFNNPHSNGASVFALSQSGATSEAARWIAEKENYSELGGVKLAGLDDTNGVVRSVLIDLSQTATINSSLQMGGRVLSQLDNFTRLHNNKVEQARFMVLKSPDIPSILVETGFISNPIEERNLTNPTYQLRIGQAVFQGIKGYFWENPPAGSRIEAMVSSRFHYVRVGESLPSIAARYHVSLESIQAMNHLSKSSRIRAGQKLVIPSSWV